MNRVIHCVLLYFILIPSVSLADNKLDTNNKVTIFTELYPPYTYINADGKVVGETAEKIEVIVKKAGLDYELKILPWKRAIVEQKRTPSSLIYPLTRNKTREQHYQWLIPFRTMKLYLYGMSNKFDANHNIKKSSTFACYTQSAFCAVLEEFGIPKSSIIIISSIKVNKQFDLLMRGRVDFVIEAESAFDDFLKAKDVNADNLVRLDNYQFNITDYLATNLNSNPMFNKRLVDAAKSIKITEE